MDNNKINVRNVYIELLNKMKAIEGVDIEYIDRLVALLYEDINFIGNAVDEIMKLIPSGASETDKLVIQSVVTAIQALIPDTATPTNKLATMSDIPAAQVNSDWNAVSGVAQILNKPNIPDISSLNKTIYFEHTFQVTDWRAIVLNSWKEAIFTVDATSYKDIPGFMIDRSFNYLTNTRDPFYSHIVHFISEDFISLSGHIQYKVYADQMPTQPITVGFYYYA